MSSRFTYATLGECKATIRSEEFTESPDARLEFFDFFFSDATAQWRTATAKDALSSLSSSAAASGAQSTGGGASAITGPSGTVLGTVEYRSHFGYISPTIATQTNTHLSSGVKGRTRSDSFLRGSGNAGGGGEEWLEIALVGVQDPWSLIRGRAAKYVAHDFFAVSGYSSSALSQILAAWSKADAWYKKAGLLALLQIAVFEVKDLNAKATPRAQQLSSSSYVDEKTENASTPTPVSGRGVAQRKISTSKAPSFTMQSVSGGGSKTPMKSYLRPTARSEAAAAAPKAPPTPVQYRRTSSLVKVGSGSGAGQFSSQPSSPATAGTRPRVGAGASNEAAGAKTSNELTPPRVGWPEQAMSQLVSVVALPSLQHEQLPVREAAIDFLTSTAKHFVRLRSFIIDYISRTIVTYTQGSGEAAASKAGNGDAHRTAKTASSPSLARYNSNARIPTPSSDSNQRRTTRGSQDTSDRDNDVCSTSETESMAKSTGARVSFLIDGCTCAPVSISSSLHALEGSLRCASRMSEYFLPMLDSRRNPFRIAILTLASHPAAVVRQQIAELWSADSPHGLDDILTVFADSLPENDDDHRLRNFSLSTVPLDMSISGERSTEDKGWRLRETVLMAMSVMLAKRCRGALQATPVTSLSECQDANSFVHRPSSDAPSPSGKTAHDSQSDEKPHVSMSKWPANSQAQLLVRALACATSYQYEVSRMGKQVLPLVTQYVVRNARSTLPFLQHTLELLYSSAQYTTLESLDEVVPSTVPPLFTWIVWFSSIRLTLNSADELSLAAAIANISPMRRLKHWKTVTLKAVSAAEDTNSKPSEENNKRGTAEETAKKARVVLLTPTAAPVTIAEKKALLSIPMPACDLAAAAIVFATYFPSCPRYVASVASKVETWEIALRIDPEVIKYAADFAATSLARPRRPGHLASVTPSATTNPTNEEEECDCLLANIVNRTSTLHLIPTWLQGLGDMETHQQCLALSAVSISLRELYPQPPIRKSAARGTESSKTNRTRHMDPDALRGRSFILSDAPVAPERLSITVSPNGIHHLFQFGYVSTFVAPSLQDGGDGAAQGFDWLKSVHPTTSSLPHVDLVQATADAAAQKTAEEGTSYFGTLKKAVVSRIQSQLFFNASCESLYVQRGVEPCVMHILRHLLTDMLSGSLIDVTCAVAVVIVRLDTRYPQWMSIAEAQASRPPSVGATATPWNRVDSSQKANEGNDEDSSDDWDDDDDDSSDEDNKEKVAGANVATEMISAHTLLKLWCTTHFNGEAQKMVSSFSRKRIEADAELHAFLRDSSAFQEKVRYVLEFRTPTDE